MWLLPAQDHGSGQGRKARRHVDHGAAGKVLHAPLEEHSLGMPGPVRQRAVDQEAPQHQEQKICRKPHTLGERAGDQGRRDDRELELEHREDQQGNRQLERRFAGPQGDCPVTHIVEHEEGERVADQSPAADVVAERQPKAHEDPDQADHAQRDHALQHGRDNVLETDHASVEERQAGRHEQHQARSRQHPRDVPGVESITRRQGMSCCPPNHGQHGQTHE